MGIRRGSDVGFAKSRSNPKRKWLCTCAPTLVSRIQFYDYSHCFPSKRCTQMVNALTWVQDLCNIPHPKLWIPQSNYESTPDDLVLGSVSLMFYFGCLLFFLAFSGERPFVCNRPNCCKSFVSKSKLVEHLQRHNGEKRHMCSLCGKKYANKHDLRAHTRYVSHALSIQWLPIVSSSLQWEPAVQVNMAVAV